MSDQPTRGDDQPDQVDRNDQPERRMLPVLWGLLALVAAAVIVGGVLAVGASVATKAAGLGDASGGSTAESTQEETLFLPEPSETGGEPGSYITLSDVPEPKPPKSTFSDTPAPPEEEITLESGQTQVSPMQEIDLTGTYPGGDGAVLRVQQLQGGTWADFPVTVPVYGDSFSTFIQASALGLNQFRVLDTDTGEASNPVEVTIG